MAVCQLAFDLLTGYISIFLVTATNGSALTAGYFEKRKVTKRLIP